ncbi:unnamed protein product [Phytophthora fragariaefolia]|uniref:Unnamed protein product n=1 Tax=Phytophthora fragariaefolia TaxID=1490495 RepID=A0A9W6Y3H1_9STRA|nr:unnamed protein product [Phytophthora fragariaefolia]
MSTPTTQTAGAPAASPAANNVVASSATTISSSAPTTTVVTLTVTTPSSPKRTMSFGGYKKAHVNTEFARDELQALFDVGSDVDLEEHEGTEFPRWRGVASSREDHLDASSSKRSRSGSDRPLADAGPLSRPRSGGDSTPSGVEASHTGSVRDPWMPTPSEIKSLWQYCCTESVCPVLVQWNPVPCC